MGASTGSISMAYMWSFFWALSLFAGYQDFLPVTLGQTTFSTLIILIGFLGSAIILGSVTTALAEMNAISSRHKQKMEEIEQYLRVKEVPKRVRRSIADFYTFAGAGNEADDLLGDLPNNLRLQLDLVLNRSLFLKVPAFRECTPGQICELVPRIVRVYAIDGQYIVQQGQPGVGLYMIARGGVQMWKGTEMLGLLGRNEFFGEKSVLTGGEEESSVQAVGMVELMVLYRKELEEVIALFPELQKIVQQQAELRDKRRDQRERSPSVIDFWRSFAKGRVSKLQVAPLAPHEQKEAADFSHKWRAMLRSESKAQNPSAKTVSWGTRVSERRCSTDEVYSLHFTLYTLHCTSPPTRSIPFT